MRPRCAKGPVWAPAGADLPLVKGLSSCLYVTGTAVGTVPDQLSGFRTAIHVAASGSVCKTGGQPFDDWISPHAIASVDCAAMSPSDYTVPGNSVSSGAP
ncbi:hypothetical protein [Pontibaca salina]|uniref:Uncharacterized protein n=1 Tax=Pontibaca salina TaxID=2795731 RepID=A0A934HMB6_9RHOB|nr:hypothetical protein [Pontibaca salina]MBI6629551.1 hypothetical protein [Pontibaca salina]